MQQLFYYWNTIYLFILEMNWTGSYENRECNAECQPIIILDSNIEPKNCIFIGQISSTLLETCIGYDLKYSECKSTDDFL